MRSSEIHKVLVGLDDGTVMHCDAVEYDDTFWLVPRWIDVPEEGFRRPERMLRLDQFEHQVFPPPSPINIAVNEPVPRALFSGGLTKEMKDKYIVYEQPDFRFNPPE